MATNPPMGRPTAMVDRINDLQGKAHTPMACTRCGGTWFYKVTAEQFSDSGYGTAQFRSLSMVPETAYVCLCGAIVENKEAVGRGVESRHGQFLNAVRNAMEYQKRNSVQLVAASCASIEEVDQMRQKVEWLEQAFSSVTETTPIEETPIEAEPEQTIEAHVSYTDPTPPPAPVAPTEKISRPARTGRPAKATTDNGNLHS